MNALVIYGSTYGNTAQVARAIGTGLQEIGHVEVKPVSEVGALPPHLDLLIVGGPTQGHGVDATVKAFLDGFPPDTVRGLPVAVFDTRLRWPVLFSGSAAHGIARRLQRDGAQLVTAPESFFVEHKEGPLAENELQRAGSWGRQLAASVPAITA